MTVDSGGTESWFDSAGTAITAPVGTSSATRFYDGSSQAGWMTDITYGPDGRPWVLWVKIVSAATDQRYMLSRWDGAAWQTVQITTDAGPLYTAILVSHGGGCFDFYNPRIVYLSRKIGSYFELQQWETADNGLTWAKTRDITHGSAEHKFTPMAAQDNDGRCAVVWLAGEITNYTPGSAYTLAHEGVKCQRLEETLKNRSGADQASLSGLDFVVFDGNLPSASIDVLARGAKATTDASGVLRIAAPGAESANVFAVITDSDGDATADSNAFSGPLQVR
jgi:hypothetical protein